MVFWREVVTEVGKQYPDVALSHMYVDNAAMQLVRNPRQFDVILAENMFGDILSDEASMIAGFAGHASQRQSGGGSPARPARSVCSSLREARLLDIAGQGVANPIAQILSLGMLFQYAFGLPEVSAKVHGAVQKVLDQGFRTRDIVSTGAQLVGTAQMGDLIVKALG